MNVHSHQQSTLLEVSLDPLLSFLDGCNDSSLDPLAFAITAEEAGADGLSIYLSAKNANVRQALMQTMSQQFYRAFENQRNGDCANAGYRV
jgi:hypothetical protein